MLPGAVSATPIYTPIHTSTPAHVFGSATTTAPTHISTNALLPFGYWYGHAETKRNPLLMDRLIRNLGENVWDRWDNDPRGKDYFYRMAIHFLFACTSRDALSSWICDVGKVSGLVVDTPASFAASSGSGNDHRNTLIKACVDAFRSELRILISIGPYSILLDLFHVINKQVNVILVVGHEKLNVEMQRTYGDHITVVKIPKSGGVSSNLV